MTRFVIDATTLLQLIDGDRHPHETHQLVAPNWIRSEALNLLLQGVIAGDRTERSALEVHERVTEVKIRLLGDRVSRTTAWRIAREQGWDSLRDAEYLAITRLQADAFVTVDDAFASRAAEVVPVAPFEALFASSPRNPPN